MWTLLAQCARPHLTPQSLGELRQRAASISDWDRALALAEYHGLGPLLYRHLKHQRAGLPTEVSRQLQGVYLRHRRGNEVRLGVLSRILEAFQGIGIESTVLKGPALIAFLYEDPGLRPLSDLDLLVPQKDAVRAQRKLGEMGFHAPVPPSHYSLTRHHHLPPASRSIDGVLVHVEIHWDAFDVLCGASLQVNGRTRGAMPFEVDGQVAYCLAPDEMLWHLCRHIHWLRLIWVSDVLGFTERFVEEIDWARVTDRYPFVMNALALIQSLAPLDDIVIQRSGVAVIPRPRGIGEEYRGWPRTAAFVWDSIGARLRFLRRTLNPPEWWLRFYYAGAAGRLYRVRLQHWAMLLHAALRKAGAFLPRPHREP